MLTALLITLREGLEAALVIAVVMSFLGRTGENYRKRFVWIGAGAAGALSLLAGTVLFFALGELSGESSEAVETGITLLAVGVLTYMIMWMRGRGSGIKRSLEKKTGSAVKATSPLALAALAFAAVGREGLETVLFLFAGISAAGGLQTLIGGSAGLVLATVAGVGLYRGSSRLNLRAFFSATGIVLIVLAAGVLASALGNLNELGLPTLLTQPVWDVGAVLSDEEGLGALLKSLLGYHSDPSMLQLIGYASYLTTMLWLYLRPLAARAKMVAAPAGVNE